jgi:hypothetical protein
MGSGSMVGEQPTVSVTGGRGRPGVRAWARGAWAQEPGLCIVGVAGLGLAAVCLVAAAVRGRFIPPEGKMLDAATFDFGVAVYVLTVALLLPLAGFSPSARRRWRRAFYVFAVYGFVLESMQAFRGLDPRFTEEGETVDVIAGVVFGLTAGLNTLLFVILAWRFFRTDVLADRPTLRLGIRYGAAAVILSFAVGILMSVNSGRDFGDEGNLLLSHGLGVHGLQTLPVVALLIAVAGSSPPATWVHAAGIGWLAAAAAAFVQALIGRPPLEPSVLSALIVGGLAVWLAIAGHALIDWRRTVPTTSTRQE